MALLPFLIFSLQSAQESISFVFSGNHLLLFKVFLFFCISSGIFITSFPLITGSCFSFLVCFLFLFLHCADMRSHACEASAVRWASHSLNYVSRSWDLHWSSEILFLLQGSICTLVLAAVFLFSLGSSCFLRFGSFVFIFICRLSYYEAQAGPECLIFLCYLPGDRCAPPHLISSRTQSYLLLKFVFIFCF